MKKVNNRMKEDLADDYCFVCKDGGNLRLCDFRNCPKAYHPDCVRKDDMFLETDERWTCGLHSCFFCQRSSNFRCFCCPKSVCRGCKRVAVFVQVRKRRKGFCNNCLKLAIMIEENIDVDSDGEKVDFEDRETFEFLFKDFWDVIKAKEGLTLADLRAADAIVKREEKCKNRSDSRLPEEELLLESGDMKDTRDQGNGAAPNGIDAGYVDGSFFRPRCFGYISEEISGDILEENEQDKPEKADGNEEEFVESNERKTDQGDKMASETDITNLEEIDTEQHKPTEDDVIGSKEELVGQSIGDQWDKMPSEKDLVDQSKGDQGDDKMASEKELLENNQSKTDRGDKMTSEIQIVNREESENEQDKPAKADRNEEEFVESNEGKTDQGDKMASEIEITILEEIGDDEMASEKELFENDQSKTDRGDKMTLEIQIVNRKESETDQKNPEEPVVNSAIVNKEKIHDAWHYLDPLGREQGPFPLEALRDWKERGFFVDSFKVRKPGQTWDEAILLTDALTQQGNYP